MKSKGTGKMKAAEARNRRRGTWVACPSCGKLSPTYVRSGEVEIHCKECDGDFEVVIRPLDSRAAEPAFPDKAFLEPVPFLKGEMVFHPDRVELCGVKIVSDAGVGHSKKMLEILSEKKPDGRFVRMSGEKLAAQIDRHIGIDTITGCAKSIRTSIRKRLVRDLDLICGQHDVLVRDEQGYHLNEEKISVRNEVGAGRNVPANAPGDAEVNERQKWVLAEAGKGGEVRRNMLEELFGVSSKTAKRDLAMLVKAERIVYVRKPSPGRYRLRR